MTALARTPSEYAECIGTRVFSHRSENPFSRENLLLVFPVYVFYAAFMIVGAIACFGGAR